MEAISKFVKLNNQNWQSWKFRMEMLLTREDLWYTIDEDRPSEPSDQWKKDDKKARATMGLCIEENQYSLVKNADSACDFWDQLQKYHEKVTITSRVSLLKKLCNLNLLEGGDVESHLFEVEDLFERLVTAGQELEDTLKVAMILRTLPDSYSGLVTALESRPEKDLTVELVKSKLLDEHERRKERSGGVADARALKSGVVEQGARPQERLCWFCEKPGHLRQDCRLWKEKKHGEKGGGKSGKKEKNTEKAKQAREECSSATLFLAGGIRHSGWIIDSGASSHMTNDRSFFASLNTEITPDVVLANGAVVQSAGCGRGIVYGINGSGGLAELTIDEVLYVPSLSNGLLSVSKLASRGLVVVFKESGCDICDSSGTVAARGGRTGSLYHLIVVESINIGESKQHNELCQHQWHRRFGHRDLAVVDKVVKDNLGIGMKVKNCNVELTREKCLEGKLARTPIPKVAERKSTQVLDLVHTDLCGPMRTSTPGGCRYLMTLIDDYSRYVVVYLLKAKSEAAGRIKEYVRHVENLFNRKPRVIRSDGGGEYANETLKHFFENEGIKAQFTTAYTPQQNGVAERRNRYLQEMARTMLLDAGLETKYWGEAVVAAAYLQNRLPSRSVDTTPYEKWHGRKPNLNHLKVFGCKAWVHIPDVKRGKFDSKARKLTFIEYSGQHKGYRFVDLATEKVTISRDAKFLELETSQHDEISSETASGEIEWIPVVEPMRSNEQEPKEELEVQEETRPTVKEESNEMEDGNGNDQSECEQFFDFSSDSLDDPFADLKQELPSDSAADSEPGEGRSTRATRGQLPERYKDYVVGIAVQSIEEPATYNKAMKCAERDSWKEATEDKFKYCPTDVMRADIPTKPLGRVKYQRFAEVFGLRGRGTSAEEEC